MAPDLLLFFPLAVLTNTAMPLPFEPVLFYYASAYPAGWCWLFVLAGGAGAGVAGVVDLRLAHLARPLVPPRWIVWLPEWPGRWFYLWTLLVAATPIPFSVVRLAMLRSQPRALPYAVAVGLGRVPRLLLTLRFWQHLALPPWLNALAIALGLALPLYGYLTERRTA